MATMISAGQMRMIRVLASRNGMDDDLLHEFIYAQARVKSLRSLTMAQAISVIDKLNGKGGKSGMMTHKQEAYIKALAKKLGWVTEEKEADMERIAGFVRERFQVDNMSWLTSGKASKVIEALKSMSEREKKHESIQERN